MTNLAHVRGGIPHYYFGRMGGAGISQLLIEGFIFFLTLHSFPLKYTKVQMNFFKTQNIITTRPFWYRPENQNVKI